MPAARKEKKEEENKVKKKKTEFNNREKFERRLFYSLASHVSHKLCLWEDNNSLLTFRFSFCDIYEALFEKECMI